MHQKARKILKAFMAGRSCEQILANDSTVTYHDIFHTVTEVPTSFWMRASIRKSNKGSSRRILAARRRVKHARD